MSAWFQWAIVAFIVLSILWHIWKGGAANPEGTGSLGKKLNALAGQVSALSGRTATQVSELSNRIGHVETEVRDLKRDGATAKDIAQLKELIDERLQSQKNLSEATNRNVQRIYDIMLEKGLGKE
jgi:galactokinase/mevalonate kinase-like predicted kinase